MSECHLPRIAILASGSGSTAEAFIRATQEDRVAAEVGLVVCNNPPEKAGIYERVERLNRQYALDIETEEISGRTHPGGKVGRGQTLAESAAICERIYTGGFDHVALMGYMKAVRGDLHDEYGWKPTFPSIYQARMTNTHPGPLPETADTYGIHASERVVQLGLHTSRHTVHLVGAGIDKGPVLAEREVAIHVGDTIQDLFERIQEVEKKHLPEALGLFLVYQEAHYEHS